jgi:ribonuclease P protein subunit RPR2
VDTQRIAEERIRLLFDQAEERFESDPELSCRYVELAKRVGERAEVSIPHNFKRKFCSSCSSFMKPGNNCRVRNDSTEEVIVYTCLECGESDRYGY